MLNKEVKQIDISNTPELIRLAEEVQKSNQVTMLTKDGKDVLEVRPPKLARRKRLKGRPTSKDDPLWRIIGIAADPTDTVNDVSINTDKYLAEAYEDKHL